MRSVCLLVSILALATAAIQQSGPVYRPASIVNSSPVGKSLNSPQQQQQQQQQQQGVPVSTQSAEERESQAQAFHAAESSNAGAIASPGTAAPAASVAPVNPQTFKILYYPSGGQVQPAAYNQYAPQPQLAPGADLWTRYRMNDVLIGAASIGLVLAGSAIWYPSLLKAKGRAMRELSEISSEDASRMAKSVLQAIERIYEQSSGD